MTRQLLAALAVIVLVTANQTGTSAAAATDLPRTDEGWTDLPKLLVPSDGSRSLGDTKADSNDSRDQGSKIIFFDPRRGDDESAEVYWWDGQRIVDSSGSATNAAGKAYGTNPLLPNEAAIKPFKSAARLKHDPRLTTYANGRIARGYPDWYLLRRGRVHGTFNGAFRGGRSQAEPMVVAGYGPMDGGRAVVDTEKGNPFSMHNGGAPEAWFHQVIAGLELHQGTRHLGLNAGCTSPGDPGVPTLLIEDCKIVRGQMTYVPIGTTVRRSVSVFNWKVKGHNQGYFTGGYDSTPTFEEVIFYKNGYKNDPRTHADPRRTIFDRNIYESGGAQMGHTYRNIISADGGSGGPQIRRCGGLIENSFIMEGYWFSSCNITPWLIEGNQSGRSAVTRNNVQLVFNYPSPNDPDTGDPHSDPRAQPGTGYTLQGASFGGLIEGNIVSGAMLTDDLGFRESRGGKAFRFRPRPGASEEGTVYTMQRNTMRGNIGYRIGTGLNVGGNWDGAEDHLVEKNVFVAGEAVGSGKADALSTADQLIVRNNRFYVNEKKLPEQPWIGPGNEMAPYEAAAQRENWPDPDRTLKRYVTEELGLTLLDWSDDPWLPEEEVAPRVEAGEAYDPTGVKTFMAVATNMRRGGKDPIPASGKPSWTGDYPWDARFTGVAVVNWIREGFGLPALQNEGT